MLGSDTPGVALMVDCSTFMDRDIVYLGSFCPGAHQQTVTGTVLPHSH